MKSYSMAEQLRKGADGAARVKLLLARRFGTMIDYEGNRDKQRQGIDIRIKPWGDVEIKSDFHDTGNFFFEYECAGKPSGIMISQSDYWAYYLVEFKHIYLIPLPALKKYIRKNIKWLAAKYRKEVKSHAGKSTWTALGLAIPRDFICAAMPTIVYTEFHDKLWLAAGKEIE